MGRDHEARMNAASVILLATLASVSVARADLNQTLHRIYFAAQLGHTDAAERMIERVLKDHPKSARAHYVAAHVYVRTCDRQRARDELREAQHIQPDLAFAAPRGLIKLIAAFRRPPPERCGELI
jgi:Tfp pilus assembly protein PilF